MFHSLLSASYPKLFCCVFASSFDFWGEVSIAQSRIPLALRYSLRRSHVCASRSCRM
jgi:hypothetical protein